MNYLYYFYPAIIGLGLISSYTDIKYKKIKNKHLLISLIYATVIYTYLFLTNQAPLSYLTLFTNLIIASLLGFILYIYHIWSPGDSKLFITYALLMPTKKYNSLFIIPCLSLFVNISLVSIIGVIIPMIKDIFLKPRIILEHIFSKKIWKECWESFVIIFSITWLLWWWASKISISNFLLKIIFLYVFHFLINKILRKYKERKKLFIIILLTGLVVRFLIQPYAFSIKYFLNYLIRVIKYTFIFQILTQIFLERNSTNKSTEKNKIKKYLPLAPFMFIGTLTANSNLIFWVISLLKQLKR